MRALLLPVAAVAALAIVPSTAVGSAPGLPPGCAGATASGANSTPAAISGGPFAPPVTSTIVVSGAQPYLRDLDLITNISHTFSADLDVTLTSPAGTVVTITTDNGGSNDNVFGNGILSTRWDDDAGDPVTDAVLVNNVPTVQLVPEEAMAAFIGENPNGTWTLSVGDDAGPENGQLNSWSLALATLDGFPIVQQTQVAGTGAGPVPNPGALTATAAVAGAGAYIGDVDLLTDLPHQASGDLGISLTSPAATASTVSSNNGATFDDVFGDGPGGAPGTLWSDQAGAAMTDPGGGPVTDAEFADGVTELDLVPEEAMGAFVGESPNGTWSLEVTDLFTNPPLTEFDGDAGALDSWSLRITAITGCTPTDTNDPPTADAGGPYSVAEGDSLGLDASASTDPDMDPLTYRWDVNGDGSFNDASGETPTLGWAELVALGVDDGPAAGLPVRVLVRDTSEAADTSPPTTLGVANSAPAIAIAGPDTAVANQSATWTFSTVDPSPVDQAAGFSYAIDWDGDGTTEQSLNGGDSVQVAHAYPSPGAATIRAAATDKDGGQSPFATKPVAVGAAPAVACSNRLRGTRRADRLVGTDAGDLIRGGRGADRIRGRAGDDCLFGGRGNDRVSGGAGNDVIRTRGGGADRVSCGPGDDRVIADASDRVRGCETR